MVKGPQPRGDIIRADITAALKKAPNGLSLAEISKAVGRNSATVYEHLRIMPTVWVDSWYTPPAGGRFGAIYKVVPDNVPVPVRAQIEKVSRITADQQIAAIRACFVGETDGLTLRQIAHKADLRDDRARVLLRKYMPDAYVDRWLVTRKRGRAMAVFDLWPMSDLDNKPADCPQPRKKD